jgi:hypothetical protein
MALTVSGQSYLAAEIWAKEENLFIAPQTKEVQLTASLHYRSRTVLNAAHGHLSLLGSIYGHSTVVQFASASNGGVLIFKKLKLTALIESSTLRLLAR